MKRHTIHQRIRTIICTCVVMCTAVGIVCIEYFAGVCSSQMYLLHDRIAGAVFSALDERLEDVQDLSFQIFRNTQVQQQLGLIRSEQSTQTDKVRARAALRTAVQTLSTDKPPFVYMAAVVDADGAVQSYGGIQPGDAWIRLFAGYVQADTGDSKVSWHVKEQDGRSYLVLFRAIRESKQVSLQQLGYAAIVVDVPSLMRDLADAYGESMNDMILILDDTLLFTGDQVPGGALKAADDATTWKTVRLEDGKYFLTHTEAWEGRLHFITATPHGRILEALNHARAGMLCALCLALLVFSALGVHAADGIFHWLDYLTQKVQMARAGDWKVSIDDRLLAREDEVGVLARHFKALMDQIDHLVNSVLRKQLAAAQAECKLLHAQIHPHFLYNTLDTIHAMAVKGGNPQIAQVTQSLSHLVRKTFRGEMFVPLSEEIDLVRQYLCIYKIRFGARLRVVLQYREEDENLQVPQMTLQPLIENAIRYGLMQKGGIGRIVCRIRRSGGDLKVCVMDNGSGFPQEQAKRYSHPEQLEETEMHGLANVARRLHYTYGRRACLQIRSRPGRWTNVSICIQDVEIALERGDAGATGFID